MSHLEFDSVGAGIEGEIEARLGRFAELSDRMLRREISPVRAARILAEIPLEVEE